MKHTVITIGREYGSGGRLIAKMLAENLGIPFYDKELIQKIAQETGFSESFVRENEKRPTGSFLFDLYSNMQTPSLSEQVFLAQSKIIREIGQTESCVIVGRCADYILQEHVDRLRVFVYAPIEDRMQRAKESYGVVEQNLQTYVVRRDKARASYYNYFTIGRWGNRQEYDLCINSSLGLERAVATIEAAIKTP